MDLRELECFVAVAHGLHFRRAAEELHLSPATVSEAIARLESSLGAALFDRSTRSVSLTEFGEAFLPTAEMAYGTVENAYDDARARAAARPSGFRVGHRGNLGTHLGVACAEIQKVCGYVDVQLVEMSTARQLESIRRGELDAGVLWGPPDDDALESRPIQTAGFLVLVERGHPFEHRGAVTMDDLRSQKVILWPRPASPYLFDCFAAGLSPSDRTLKGMEGVHGVDNAVTQVLAGRGVGIAPDSESIDSLRLPQPGLPCVAIPIDDSPAFEMHLAKRRGDSRKRISMLADLLEDLLPDRAPVGCSRPPATGAREV